MSTYITAATKSGTVHAVYSKRPACSAFVKLTRSDKAVTCKSCTKWIAATNATLEAN